MAYEQRPGDISIFREDDKKNEKGPDWKGTCIVPVGAKPGDVLEVAIWKKGTSGTMLAGQIKPKGARSAPRDDRTQPAERDYSGEGAMDDEMPF